MPNCKIMVVFGLLSSVMLTVARYTPAASVGSQPEPSALLVELQEGTMDMSRQGGSGHTCVLVLPDGRFHLESRTQRLPGAVATLNVSDYSLDSSQLQQLRTVLDDERMRHLPAYVQPAIPMAVPWSHAFSARIAREKGVQQVGYWTWRGGTPAASPNSAAASVKKGWQESETVLRPLVDWLHGVEALKLSPSETQSTMCSNDGNSTAP
jgi:hypothetical protein